MTTSRSRGVSAAGEADWTIDQTITDALADLAGERTLNIELGALRMMLLRLLAEEGDVGRLAGYVARVAGVAVQAARAQSEIADADDDLAFAHFFEHTAAHPTAPARKEAL